MLEFVSRQAPSDYAGTVIVSEQGRILQCDDTAANFMGMDRAMVPGLEFFSLQPLACKERGGPHDRWLEMFRRFDTEQTLHLTLSDGCGDQAVRYFVTATRFKSCDTGLVHITLRKPNEHIVERERMFADAHRVSILLDHMRDGILVEDSSRRIVMINQRFCELFALSAAPAALAGQDCSGFAELSKEVFLHPEHFIDGVNIALLGEVERTADELPLRDGRTFERDYIPIRHNERLAGHLWIYRDVTERKQVMSTLLRNEALVRSLYEQAQTTRFELIRQLASEAASLASAKSVETLATTVEQLLEKFVSAEYTGLYLLDAETQQLRLYSAKGFTDEERHAAEISAMDRHPGWVLRNAAILHVPDVQDDKARRSESSPRSFEVGERFYVPVMGSNGCVGAFGIVGASARRFGPEEIELMSFVATISGVIYENLVQAENLKKTQAELRIRDRAIRSSRTGIVITDALQADDPVIYVNPALERITGYPADEILGRNPRFLHGSDVDQEGLTVLREALKFNSECTVALRNYRKSGEMYWVELSISPIIRDDGVVTHHIGIQTDINERMRTQQLLEQARDDAIKADHAKSGFLATMSHEIRTPMNGVIGAADLLALTMLDHEQREYVETIQTSGKHLLQIINDILDLSRIEAGKLEIHPKLVSIRVLIDEILRFFSIAATQRSIKLSAKVVPAVPDLVRVDPVRLKQVLLNIVSNAVKFTEKGSICLTVDIHTTAELITMLRIEVKDTGIGMTVDMLQRIFEPFAQADDSNTRLYGGTGLGLAISAHLIALMDGSIAVRSFTGQGSTFVIDIPFLPIEQADAAPRNSAELFTGDWSGVDPSRLRVLVVEDVRMNRMILIRMLQHLGITPEVAVNGKEAVEMAREKTFDVILMDVQMPVMDGLEATRMIRERVHQETQPIIIAVTAGAIMGEKEKCIAAGMDDFISKPLKREDIRRMVEVIIEKLKH